MHISETANVPIAQMNFGKMLHKIDDQGMQEFSASLDSVYKLAEKSTGFIWRIPDDQISKELTDCGYDERTSATVSVWASYESLKHFTFVGLHGDYFRRSTEWFCKIEPPQLVIWPVSIDERPSFVDALAKLKHLAAHGDTDKAFGWID